MDDQSPDGVLVPLDTWTRVMDQLGNLHEAGQQLAEARERAARAETQVEFLKSQLAETRAKLADPPGGSGPGGTAAGPEPTPEPAPAPRSAPASPPATGRAAPQPGAGGRLSSARNRLGAWLSTD